MITGQVGVITANPGWYGRLVQWFTHSPAYHTVSAISETLCVSAETPRVIVRPINHFRDVRWTDVPLTAVQRHDIVNYWYAQVGKRYAYFDIVLLFVAILLKSRTPWWVRVRLVDTDRWFCSELADAGMEAGGVNLFPGRPACAVIPKDWLRVVSLERV